MILLEPHNVIIRDTLMDKLTTTEADKCHITCADFDGVTYRLSTPESKTQLVLSMSLKCFGALKAFGAQEILQREYGDLLLPGPEPGFDVSLVFEVGSIPSEHIGAVVQKVALLKRWAMAAPFEVAFDAQQAGQSTPLMAIPYRDGEVIYIQGQPDRVTVIFSTVFAEETDRIIGKVFLQEFVDARRQPSIQNAPQVLYSPREPPLELKGVPGVTESENIGYVTFVLFPRHFVGEKRDEAITRIQLFRDYLHYHIKASKAYMHSRMRARVDSFLKVLNRAKPEQPDDKKEKKTASGKTFRRA